MCCASIHLLIGALLILAVENEATTMISSIENTTAPVSVFSDNTTLFKEKDILDNFTSPSFNATLQNTTVVDISDGESESSTPPPSEHPQTNNYTTDDSLKTVSQSSTNNMIKSTTNSKTTTIQATQPVKNHGPTYIVIFIIAALCLLGVVVYCCHKTKSRKYSVDLHPKQEDVQIPLSTVDVEVFDTTSVKDMQTFSPVESTEPLKDPAPAEKPEGGKESADLKQENQPNLSSTQATEDTKDKMEGLTVVDLTDGDLTISTKTSMESLDDVLNENNSNNTRLEVKGNGHDFTEISIDALLYF
ncbi:uncharacterized protein si:dkey-27h10.2 [Onychostoma macrolepis]|uniref:Uncharacterized protein n=1 Tax=Onychostoma macrolepis TaxID=369639 RepID=A0A7J6DH13_9TELE|nr:uncharacterized protein si:dkey-27h10.2 [Onychostoma macrolepis]XP_058629046.1 uncharacterized protein si:dkey-27h10.2 [Onychostoma macrolepis]KAF4118628.1 hypothetical protein G5714_000679 [Onychostoma macrolepis]